MAISLSLSKTTFADEAEKVIKELVKDRNHITNTKLRNLLSMVNKVMQGANQSDELKLSNDELRDIQYLKMRLAYECGRDTSVRKFVELSKIDTVINKIGDNRKLLELFADYMESLVAYHKFYSNK